MIDAYKIETPTLQIEKELYADCEQFHPSFSSIENNEYSQFISAKSFFWNKGGLVIENEENTIFNNQGAYETFELPSYYTDNKKVLKEGFNKEYGNNHRYFMLEKDVLQYSYDNAASLISELPFEYASVEFTPNKAIKFNLTFEGEKLLMITKFIEADVNEPILYSLFINRKLIASNVSEISTFIEGFKEFLSM